MAPVTAASTGPYGRPPPVLLISTLIPVSLTLILHPLLPLLMPSTAPFLPPQPKYPALQANIGFAMLAYVGAVWSVPQVAEAFIGKALRGRDLLKPGGRTSGPWVPECLGLPCASLYIALLMLFIPFPFSDLFSSGKSVGQEAFPQGELTLYLSSLLSLLTATLLGFIDDLFDIRWRHKLPIPLIASIPTLLVYYSQGGWTDIILPASLGSVLGRIHPVLGWAGPLAVELGPLYYVYLAMLPTFTTNSINILAGVNGVEVTQAFIIAISVAANDLIFLPVWPHAWLTFLGVGNPHEGRLLEWAAGEVVKRHLMSLYFMLPMIGVCAGFLWHNWYPARAFPGDTFCYFTGMAFSAVAIQGHFSKTLILFFIPQIFNFVMSCPQLFGLVDCPRHRLPHFNPQTGLLEPSLTMFEKAPPARTRITLEVMELVGLVRLDRLELAADAPPRVTRSRKADAPDTPVPKKANGQILSSTNLTILNFILVHFGPLHERTLCIAVGALQAACSVLAFGIRYGVGSLVYGGDRR